MRRGAVLALVVAGLGCGRVARAPAPGEPVAAPPSAPAIAPPFVVAEGQALTVTRDATHLWWITPTAIHRRPLGGPDAGAIETIDHAVGDALVAFAAHRDHAYVCAAGQVVAVGLDGAVTALGACADARDIAADDAGVYLADSAGVLRRDRDGRWVRLIVSVEIEAIVVADDRLYRMENAEVRVTSTDGAAITELHLAPGVLSVDDDGAIAVRTRDGDLIERDAAGRLHARSWPEGPWRMGRGAVAVAEGWLYVEATAVDGRAAVLALPRTSSAGPLRLDTGDGYLGDLEVEGGALFWTIGMHLVRGDPASGDTAILEEVNHADRLVVTPRWIYTGGDGGVTRIPRSGGAREQLDSRGSGLAVAGDVAAWASGTTLRVWRDGERFDLAVLEGLSWLGAIVIGADHLYVASGHGIYRVDERGQVTLGDDGLGRALRLAMVARDGALFVLTATGAFEVAAGAAPVPVLAAPDRDALVDLVGCAGWLYAISGAGRVIRIDADGPDPVVLRVAPRGARPAGGALACDAHAVYVHVAGATRIARLPHDAPALPVLD